MEYFNSQDQSGKVEKNRTRWKSNLLGFEKKTTEMDGC